MQILFSKQNSDLNDKVNKSELMKEVWNGNTDISAWTVVNGVSSGFVYFFLLAVGEIQYVCPIYVNTVKSVMCRCYIDNTVYLAIESGVTYVNARLYGGSGALLRVYKIR